jgi:hypothetical protein
MTSDQSTGRIFLFGGQAGFQNGEGAFADTWVFDQTGWHSIVAVNTPPARIDMAIAYDTKRGRLLVFGGFSGQFEFLNDTWALIGNVWVPLPVSHSPPVFQKPTMVYDESRDKVVLVDIIGRTWEFDGGDWLLRQPPTSPPMRSGLSLAYDNTRGRVVLFGGEDLNQIGYNDTWEFDGFSWRQQFTPDVASLRVRSSHAVLYDSTRSRILTMGGFVGGRVANDIWSFGFGSASAPRDRCLAGEDSDGDGLIGCGDATHLADPDCAGQCTPLCPPTTSPVPCDPNAPRCGDGICNPLLESYLSCPVDCSRP